MRADAEEAPQPARPGAVEAAALEALKLDYGTAYLIGYDDKHGYYAARRDEIGGLLKKGSPDELRAAMAEDHALKPVQLWCSHCGQRAVFAGGAGVHAATLNRTGRDGHAASVTGREPPLWKSARRLQAEYGGTFEVSAKWGILRADWSPAAVRSGAVAAHYEASGDGAEEDLRRQLGEMVRGTRWERKQEDAAP